MHLADINFLAVGVAGIAAFVLGMLWYSLLFGKIWQKELGFTDEYIQNGNMGVIFGSSFVLMVLMALGLALLITPQLGGAANWQLGAHHGLIAGVLFVGGSMGINYLYQRRSIKLWLIDAGYQICFLVIMGTIIGLWPK